MALKKYDGKLTGNEKIGINLQGGNRAFILVNDLLEYVKSKTPKPEKVPEKKTTTKKAKKAK